MDFRFLQNSGIFNTSRLELNDADLLFFPTDELKWITHERWIRRDCSSLLASKHVERTAIGDISSLWYVMNDWMFRREHDCIGETYKRKAHAFTLSSFIHERVVVAVSVCCFAVKCWISYGIFEHVCEFAVVSTSRGLFAITFFTIRVIQQQL